jgi:hypothetical protein
MSESDFPTIRDLREALSELIERGLGDLAVQIVVAPDSTMQALARCLEPNYSGKPALMIDVARGTDGRLPVALISTERLHGGGRSTTTQ